MPNKPEAKGRAFKVICSEKAAAELREEECRDIIKRAILEAQQKDRGVHEGLTFSFDLHGKAWSIVVDLQEGWVKICGKDELDETIQKAVGRN